MKLITNARPATLHEAAYARAERESRPWFLVYRPSLDVIGITPKPDKGDEVIMICDV